MELVEAGWSTRHTGCQRPDERGRAARFAVLSEVHVVRGGGWSGLSEVERLDFSAEARHRESAAAQIPGRWVYDGQSKRGGDCGIGRVAARAEDLEAGFSGRRSSTGNGATRAANGLRMSCLGYGADRTGPSCEDQGDEYSTNGTPDIPCHCRSVAELIADFVRIDQ